MSPLWQFDQDLFKAIHVGMHRDWLDPVMRGLSYSGLGYIQAVPLILAAFFLKLHQYWRLAFVLLVAIAAVFVEKTFLVFGVCILIAATSFFLDKATARCALAALVVSGLVRVVIAQSVARQRPGTLPFATPLEHVTGASSFPSGHATTTFAILSILCWRYARTENAWIAWASLGWGALVCLSRIYVGVHFPTDVLGGAVLGTAFGSACYWFWLEKGWASQDENVPMDLNRS